METKLLIIGKGDNIITMILDNLYSEGTTPTITIYNNLTSSGVGALWTGNHHCGWSDGNHMLHGSTNLVYPSGYPGFCLDGTCWNEAGIVWIAGT